MQLQLTLETSTKQCRKCLAQKPLTEFHRNRGSRDGLYAYCKSCANAESKRRWEEFPEVREAHRAIEHRYKARLRGDEPAFSPRCVYQLPPEIRRTKSNTTKRRTVETMLFLHAVKSAVGCQVCGERDPYCVDFHHIDPASKHFAISARATRSVVNPKKIIDEIKKCVCLCANCHRKHHHRGLDTEQLAPIDDGTLLRVIDSLV